MMSPFLTAFATADGFGKLIFLGLFVLSIISWVILVHKFLLLRKIEAGSTEFASFIKQQKEHLFRLKEHHMPKTDVQHPFTTIYFSLKQKTQDFLAKNQYFKTSSDKDPVYLSKTDVEAVQTDVNASISREGKMLEKNLFMLSTIVTLAPFLGLLGTVWGILVAFNELQGGASLGSSTALLGGLSTALTTTVLGLLIAIPALIGYNYLKNAIRSYEKEMEDFGGYLTAQVELQYRQVDLK
ncbi:MAG: MotA/TolQ/ExbB proton channel family protein [Chlamydiia bacterium]|nr:MotA/TolQ/ExbB proton channel family protein [Chlamydiia bacterium]MCP5509501.1 MotA/TolQ/ExbB proton channel family protein [Chlamydiales bacterium]